MNKTHEFLQSCIRRAIWMTGIQGLEKDKGIEILFKEILTETLPVGTGIRTVSQVYVTSERQKEDSCIYKGRYKTTCRVASDQLTAGFSTVTLQTRKDQHEVFIVLKEKSRYEANSNMPRVEDSIVMLVLCNAITITHNTIVTVVYRRRRVHKTIITIMVIDKSLQTTEKQQH